jgi:hypothetical protein
MRSRAQRRRGQLRCQRPSAVDALQGARARTEQRSGAMEWSDAGDGVGLWTSCSGAEVEEARVREK